MIKVIVTNEISPLGGRTNKIAKEVNEVTNPKMGKRHVNYESMLRKFEIDECDGFCCGECAVMGCKTAPIAGDVWRAEFYTSANIEMVQLMERVIKHETIK